MDQRKREHPKEKARLHPRNKHRTRYDLKLLSESHPDLKKYIKLNLYGDESVDFADPHAVKALNTALLKSTYGISYWDIPEGYLCPPVPGRADYIHYVADILGESNYGTIPTGSKIRCLDIGVGANCIYPIIGSNEYGWSFVGVDTDPLSIDSALKICEMNPQIADLIEIRKQRNHYDFFNGAISKEERFHISICNPPFHASEEEAQSASIRKVNNLTENRVEKPVLNFAGQYNELCYKGGEAAFIGKMIVQSKHFSESCVWFSSLVSKQSHIKGIQATLKNVKANDVRIITMGQGNKTSRIVVWSFLPKRIRNERLALK